MGRHHRTTRSDHPLNPMSPNLMYGHLSTSKARLSKLDHLVLMVTVPVLVHFGPRQVTRRRREGMLRLREAACLLRKGSRRHINLCILAPPASSRQTRTQMRIRPRQISHLITWGIVQMCRRWPSKERWDLPTVTHRLSTNLPTSSQSRRLNRCTPAGSRYPSADRRPVPRRARAGGTAHQQSSNSSRTPVRPRRARGWLHRILGLALTHDPDPVHAHLLGRLCANAKRTARPYSSPKSTWTSLTRTKRTIRHICRLLRRTSARRLTNGIAKAPTRISRPS